MKEQRRPRGPAPRVSREEIIDAALAEGIHRFTLPAVARRIGLSHSGIYRQFADREALINACIARVADEVPWKTPDPDWRVFFHDYAESLWDGFAQYPGAAEALLQATEFPRSILAWQQKALTHLADLGITAELSAVAIDLIGDLVWIGVVGAERVTERDADGRTRADKFEASITAADPTPSRQWYGKTFLHTKVDLVLIGIAHSTPE